MSFVEVLMAIAILALGLIPVFGLMTQGLHETDVGVTYTTGSKIAEAVMNHLLSGEVPFASLPLTNAPPGGGVAVYPVAGAPPSPAHAGNVVLDPALDPIFPVADWVADAATATRARTDMGTRYHVQVWVGNYGLADDLRFWYFEPPEVDWMRTSPPFRYARTLVTSSADVGAGFSPYIADASTAVLVPGSSAWGSSLTSHTQDELSEEVGAVPAFRNFAKIVVRVSWLRRDKRDNRWNEFYLVSFRANREG